MNVREDASVVKNAKVFRFVDTKENAENAKNAKVLRFMNITKHRDFKNEKVSAICEH